MKPSEYYTKSDKHYHLSQCITALLWYPASYLIKNLIDCSKAFFVDFEHDLNLYSKMVNQNLFHQIVFLP